MTGSILKPPAPVHGHWADTYGHPHPGPASLRNTLEQGEIVEEGHDKLSLDAVMPGGRRVESGLEKTLR